MSSYFVLPQSSISVPNTTANQLMSQPNGSHILAGKIATKIQFFLRVFDKAIK
jgi:hypothetical protein